MGRSIGIEGKQGADTAGLSLNTQGDLAGTASGLIGDIQWKVVKSTDGTGDDLVVARSTIQSVVSITSRKAIVICAAIQDIITGSTIKRVIANPTRKDVIAIITAQGVLSLAAIDRVVPRFRRSCRCRQRLR